MTNPRQHSPLRPLGDAPRRRGGGSGGWSSTWNSFSPRRKFRLIRSGVILLVLIILIWSLASRCGTDGTTVSTGTTTTVKKNARTTTTSTPPPTVTAALLAKGLPSPHYEGATTVAAGKVVIMGGLSKAKASTNLIWQFDPATGATTALGSLVAAQHDASAGTLGDTPYVFGGSGAKTVLDTIESLAPGAKKSTVVGKLPKPRTGAVGITDTDGPTLYVVGGTDGANGTNEVLSSIDGLNFQTVATLPEPVKYASAAIVGTQLFVFGGEWNNVQSQSIQLVDLAKQSASVVAKMPEPVSHAMAFVLNGTIFLAGGRVGGGRTDAIRRFDPTTYTFANAGTLPSKVSDSSVATIGNSAFLLGGLAPIATSQIIQISPSP